MKKRTHSKIIVGLLLLSLTLAVIPTVEATGPRSVKGVLYIEGQGIAPAGIEVQLRFSGETASNITYTYNLFNDECNFRIGWWGHDGETGVFKIIYLGIHELDPTDNQTFLVETIGKRMDLHIDISGLPATDTEPPSKVTGLTVSDAKDGKLDLSWNVATDNEGVDHYRIYRNSGFLTTTAGTSYQDTGLTDGQSYSYEVSAVDTSDNEGEKSDPVSGTPTASSGGGNGGNGGGNDGGGTPIAPPPTNAAPNADADGPYQGFIGEAIDFDASQSSDSDGTIELYEWDWDNDGSYDESSSSATTTHSWPAVGAYTIKLRVTDDDNAKDTDTTTVNILKANNPPENLTITGETTGDQNIDYTSTVSADDPDGDNITYTIDWGDSTDDAVSTELPTGTSFEAAHNWTTYGIYTITLTAADDETQPQTTATMYIDVEVIDDVIKGYLYDEDSDGTYDGFHNYDTELDTPVEKTEEGKYLINSDEDSDYDYIYNPADKTLEEYSAPTTGEGEEDNTLLYIAAIIGILVIIGIFYAATRKGGKKPEPPKKKPKK